MLGKNLHLTLLLGAVAALSACGSSSSSNPVDPPPPPPPPPPAAMLTLNGFVTDMPIVNADVVVTVDGQSFTADNPTGADGSYTVDIETDDTDALVTAEATDPNGTARFVAILNSFAGLLADAGGDGIADDANVTNVTTALVLLAEQLATDGSIDDIAELETLAAQVDATELLELAAAIKIVVDNVQGVVLPPEFADVQELAQAIVDGTSTFLADVETTNPGIVDETIDAIVDDGFASIPITAESAPGAYVSVEDNDITVLMADGSGYLAEYDPILDEQIIEDVTWSLTEGGALVILFTATQDTDTLVLLSEAGNVQTFYETSVEGGVELESEPLVATRYGFDPAGFDAASAAGSYHDQEIEEGDSETEYTVLMADGSGYDIDVDTGAQTDLFTWTVNAAGELILVDDGIPDGPGELDEQETVRLLDGSTADVRNVLAFEFDLAGTALMEIEVAHLDYTTEIMMGPQPDTANTLLLEGKTYAFFDGFDRGLITLGTNGVFGNFFQDFDQIDGPEFGEEEATWFVDADGVIRITFPAVGEDPEETDVVTVVSGLGEDVMVISMVDEGVPSELTLHRVLPFDANDNLVGTWDILDGGQATTETVTFAADNGGAYFDQGVLDEGFEWAINAAGTLVATLDDPTAVFTDNFHKLADSTADNIHFLVVFRMDGALNNDTDDPLGPPEVMIEGTLVRQP